MFSIALQIEAAMVLTLISCGTTRQTKAIVLEGALPVFMLILNVSQDMDLNEQTIWTLGIQTL